MPPKWATKIKPTHGKTNQANQAGNKRVTNLALMQEIMDLPAANAGLFEMKEDEIKRFRSRIYSLNRDNAFGWKWRTLVEPKKGIYNLLLVWRIH